MKSLAVQQQGISAMIEQQRHNLYMSLARTPVQGRRMERAACGVHIRAAGQQQPAAVIMAIDSGPVQSRHALLVTLIRVYTRIQMRTHTVDTAVLRTRMQRLARHGGRERRRNKRSPPTSELLGVPRLPRHPRRGRYH